MTDNTELKRLAQRVIDIEALDGGEPICEAWGEFEAAATPAAVLALIAENELLAKTADCWDRLNIQNKALSDSFRTERDQLRAEIAGLKTGYEAYERVNAELKGEVEGLRNALRPLLAHWDDLRPGESINVDAARAALGQGGDKQ
ncbi:hypothetical protein [Pseudomonas veronii]